MIPVHQWQKTQDQSFDAVWLKYINLNNIKSVLFIKLDSVQVMEDQINL